MYHLKDVIDISSNLSLFVKFKDQWKPNENSIFYYSSKSNCILERTHANGTIFKQIKFKNKILFSWTINLAFSN
jgi:hypothetical protein